MKNQTAMILSALTLYFCSFVVFIFWNGCNILQSLELRSIKPVLIQERRMLCIQNLLQLLQFHMLNYND